MDLDAKVEVPFPVIVLYVVLVFIGLGILAFIWREFPAVIRYIKSEMM